MRYTFFPWTAGPRHQVANWGSILTPAGTPRAVVQTLNSAIRQVLNMPVVKDRYNKMGFDFQPTTPEELETRLTQEMIKYIEVVNKAGITSMAFPQFLDYLARSYVR